MEDNQWFEGIEKEIGSLKEKMSKGDYSAYELDGLLRIAKRVSNLSDECSQCAESREKISNALKGMRDYPNTSKEHKDNYIRIFRTIINHFEKNHSHGKGCSYKSGLYIVVIVLGIWILVGIGGFTETPFVLLTALIPLGSLIVSLYKQRIGGLLIILSGFLPIIILINIPGLKSDMFYGIGVMATALFVTLPLCIAGIIITRAKPRKIESEKKENELTGFIDCKKCDAIIPENAISCPKCGVEFEGEIN
jgi:hypothetical protein